MRTRQQILDYLKEYRENHRERIAIQKAEWYRKHRKRERQKRKMHYQANKEAYFARARRRRSKVKGGDTRLYSREQILERTAGTCYICDGFINLLLKWPHEKSFSFHHIIATSKGGSDDIGNVVPAHLGCNISQGDRLYIKVEKLPNTVWGYP